MFDYALLIGMTSDEYWFADPSLIYNYQNAFNRRQEYDLQLAWSLGGFFKSALGSTQLWTVQPEKKSDWAKMPKYIDNPVKEKPVERELSPEKKELMEKARARLIMLGLLGD